MKCVLGRLRIKAWFSSSDSRCKVFRAMNDARMADKNTQSSGSAERVAYDMMVLILEMEKGITAETAREEILKLYAVCLAVTKEGDPIMALSLHKANRPSTP